MGTGNRQPSGLTTRNIIREPTMVVTRRDQHGWYPERLCFSAVTSEIRPLKARRADLSHPARRDSGLGFKERNLEPQALKGRATRVEFVRFDYLLRSAQRLVAALWRAIGAPLEFLHLTVS